MAPTSISIDSASELQTIASLPVHNERSKPALAESTENAMAVHQTEHNKLSQNQDLPEIIIACQRGDFLKVRELIEADPSLAEFHTEDGVTPLHWAAINNNVDICAYLIQNGAPIDYKGGELAATPLQWACRNGHVKAVHLLIQNGADPLRSDSQGFNALHLAVHSSNVMLIIYLLHQGLPIDMPDPNGQTALHWAAYQGDDYSVDVLLRWGVDVRTVNNSGFTALHWAIVRGNKKCIKRLIEEGSDVFVANDEGKSPSVMAHEMSVVPAWETALKESGRNTDGTLRLKTMSDLGSNLSIFFLPYLIIFWTTACLSFLPVFIAIPFAGLMLFVFTTILNKIILPNLYRGHNALIKSPFLSGLFSGSAFWIFVRWVYAILPATFSTSPVLNIAFAISFSIALYCFFKCMFMDPGFIPKAAGINAQKQVIEVLIDRNEFDIRHYDIVNFIRKPLRSRFCIVKQRVVARYDHYCPWVNNAIGLRNHRLFIIFLLGIEVSIPLFLVLTYRYILQIPDDYNHLLPCAVTEGDVCKVLSYDGFTLIMAGWAAIQLVWVTFVLFVQLFQISRSLTTKEATTAHMSDSFHSTHTLSTGTSTSDSLLRISDANQQQHHHHHHKSMWSVFLRLLGIDQFYSTVQDAIHTGSSNARSIRKYNPADYGILRNCSDFWFPDANYNVFREIEGGQATLGGQHVDYYSLWDLPSRNVNGYESVANIV